MNNITIPAGDTIDLPANTYIRVGYIFTGWNTAEDGTGTAYQDLNSYSSEVGANINAVLYAQWRESTSTLYDMVATMSKGVQTVSSLRDEILSPTSTDLRFDTSNSGVYRYNPIAYGDSSDLSNDYNIYYYRGILEPEADQGTYGSDGQATTYPNYVKFANNTCWRIIRTTGSGGVKMIYNGVWNDTIGACANNKGNVQVGSSNFSGIGPDSDMAIRPGYTFDVNYASYSATYYRTIAQIFGTNDGDNNTTSSSAKESVDNWYASNLGVYTGILEGSAGYCGDRTVYSGSVLQPESFSTRVRTEYSSGSYTIDPYSYGAAIRNSSYWQSPSFACAKYYDGNTYVDRSKVDLYSVESASTGNGRLAYPVALLTADEASLAGSGTNSYSYNEKSFLNSGSSFWLLSAAYRDEHGVSHIFDLDESGALNSDVTYVSKGLRPVVSFKSGMLVVSGDGTSTDPWIVDEDNN